MISWKNCKSQVWSVDRMLIIMHFKLSISWSKLGLHNFSGDQKLQIMLLQLLISWSYLWQTNFSGDRKLQIMLLQPSISWKFFWTHEFQEIKILLQLSTSWKVTKKFDLLIKKTFDLLFWSPKIGPPEPMPFMSCNLVINLIFCLISDHVQEEGRDWGVGTASKTGSPVRKTGSQFAQFGSWGKQTVSG